MRSDGRRTADASQAFLALPAAAQPLLRMVGISLFLGYLCRSSGMPTTICGRVLFCRPSLARNILLEPQAVFDDQV